MSTRITIEEVQNESLIIIQFVALGDLVATEPLIRYLKKIYPDKKLVCNVLSAFEDIVKYNPYIDAYIVDNDISGLREKIYKKAKDKKLNVIDLSGANQPLRYDMPNSFNYYLFGSLLEVYSMYAGISKLCAHPRIYFPENFTFSHEMPNDKYVVIHRFSNDSGRDYQLDKWQEIASFLVKKFNYKIVEVGSISDQSKPSLEIDKKHYLDMRGKLLLHETAKYIEKADFFIGIDSGVAHIANAVKTRGIILLGNYKKRFKKYIPYCGFYRKQGNVFFARNENGDVKDLDIELVKDKINLLINSGNQNNKKYEVEFDANLNKKIVDFLKNNDEFYLWGASGMGKLVYDFLEKNKKRVKGFIDSDINKKGKILCGKQIYHSSELDKLFPAKIIISSTWWSEISNILESKYNLSFLEDYL